LEIFFKEASSDVPAEQGLGGIRHHGNALAGGLNEIAKVRNQARLVNKGRGFCGAHKLR
jgi:hypothetical protein